MKRIHSHSASTRPIWRILPSVRGSGLPLCTFPPIGGRTDPPAVVQCYQQYWGNSIYPYTKELSDTRLPQRAPRETARRDAYLRRTAAIQPQPVTYSYNGDLHAYTMAGVNNPASCPLVWEGDGKAKLLGLQTANPDMVCGTSCGYAPVSNGSCNSTDGCIDYLWGDTNVDGPMNIHTGGEIFTYCDGHSKWRRMATASGSAKTDQMVDPYCTYDAAGYSKLGWYDSAYYHAYLFRPDYDFTTKQGSYCGY